MKFNTFVNIYIKNLNILKIILNGNMYILKISIVFFQIKILFCRFPHTLENTQPPNFVIYLGRLAEFRSVFLYPVLPEEC